MREVNEISSEILSKILKLNLFKPPIKEGVCDECGSMDFVYREDDSEESVKNRLSIYNQKTHPLIEYYRQQKSCLK